MTSRYVNLENCIQQDIKANVDWILSQGSIPPHQRKELRNPSLIRAIATFLSRKREYKDNESGVNFYLLDMKEIGGKSFPFVLCIPEDMDFVSKRGSKSNREDCFVGCRFGRYREELASVLEPILSYYGYQIRFGDTGFKAGQIFDTILEALKGVDFSIFDNRGTESKPNVYIEVGAAYASKAPHLLLEYKKSQLPANLRGFQTLKYPRYRELARTFSLALPAFFETHGIKPPGRHIRAGGKKSR